MKLDEILHNKHRSDVFGRTSWYRTDQRYQPRLQMSAGGWVKRNMSPTGEPALDRHELTDEDRLADDWVIIQSNEPPP